MDKATRPDDDQREGTTWAANFLKCSPQTVRNRIDRGELPAERTSAGHNLVRRGDVRKLQRRRR